MEDDERHSKGDSMKHKLKVCIMADGKTKELFSGRKLTLPQKLIRLLFGECSQILVLKPGETVKGIEVHEEPYNDAK